MIELIELGADLWSFGAPVVLLTWALLRLTGNARGRTRYLIVIAGFVAAVAVPVVNVLPRDVPNGVTVVVRDDVPASTASLQPATVRAIAMLWIGGAIFLLARAIAGHLRLALSARQPAPSHVRRLLSWPADVPLYDGTTAPFTAGLVRPYVVVPSEAIERIDVVAARAIARHELSHARWRDPLVHFVMRVVASVLWPSPLWALLSWSRREREHAADDAALQHADDAELYVRALAAFSRPSLLPASAVATIGGGDVVRRAERLLGSSRTMRPRGAMAATLCAFAVMTIAEPSRFAMTATRPATPVVATTDRTPTPPIQELVHTPKIVPSQRPATSRRKPAQLVLPPSRPIAALTLAPAQAAPTPPPAASPPAVDASPHRAVAADADNDRHVDVRRIRRVIRR